ncbi:hypothetical protein [Natrialba hulunbeirensis]|uniref:hypothetical protein n=1 Tax=Natrialba hulunbeirensis TaxID=123783 RepID=UPI001268A4CB|nr:hypothetical protein [Natrialba hulunbeirensis]
MSRFIRHSSQESGLNASNTCGWQPVLPTVVETMLSTGDGGEGDGGDDDNAADTTMKRAPA